MTSPVDPAAGAERRIVVGVDDSQPARLALQWAQFLAHVLDAEIDAVQAWEISAVEAEAWVDDWNPEKETAAQLRTIVTEVLGSQPQVTVREIICQGSAADELMIESGHVLPPHLDGCAVARAGVGRIYRAGY